jgi:hypothetical protein
MIKISPYNGRWPQEFTEEELLFDVTLYSAKCEIS